MEHVVFDDVQSIIDQLLKINSSSCETVQPGVKANDCSSQIKKEEDESYNYLQEKMDLFVQNCKMAMGQKGKPLISLKQCLAFPAKVITKNW